MNRLAVALAAGVLLAGGTLAASVAGRQTAANAGTTGGSPVIYTTLGAGGFDTVNLSNVGAGPTSTNPPPSPMSSQGPVAINVNATDVIIGGPGQAATNAPLAFVNIVPVSGGVAHQYRLTFTSVRGIAADPVAPGVAFAVSAAGAVDEVNFSSSAAVVTQIVVPDPIINGEPIAAYSIAVTPDGQNLLVAFHALRLAEWGVYEASLSASPPSLTDWVTSFTGPFSGTDLAVAPNGQDVYAVAYLSDPNSAPNPVDKLSLPISPNTTSLWPNVTSGAVSEPSSITVSPDGQTVYVTGVGFPNANGGAEGEVQALSAGNGSAGSSAAIPGLTSATGIADSPAGGTLLVAGAGANGSYVYPVSAGNLGVGTPASLGAAGTGVAPQDVAVTPDQGPVASLAPNAATAGVGMTLDASASTVRYGSIVRYQWLFGDGGSATTGGPTVSHTYATAGSYTATVTETDSAGASVPPAPNVTGSVDGPGETPYINAGFQARTSAPVAIGQPGKPPPTIPSVTTTTLKGAPTPVIALSPQVGTPGEVITVTGHGFLPNHSVTVKWSTGTASFTENADAHGNLPTNSLLLLVPDLLGPRTAIATSAGSPTVQQKFLVVASSAQPGSGSGSDTFLFRSEGP